MSQKWVIMSQACLILGVSRRTLTRWVKQGKIESKLDGNRRLILVSQAEKDMSHDGSEVRQDVSDMSQQALIDQLKSENQYLKEENEYFRNELKETKERSDTIIMSLTKQLENQRLALAEHKEQDRGVWFRRWFKRKETN